MFKSTPAVEIISFPLILMLSTCRAVSVPTEVIAVWAACVTVRAVPLVLPVTLPVMLPSMLATRLPVVIVRLPVLAPVAVVVPRVNLSSLSSHAKIALSPVLPRSITIPQSFALLPAPLLSSINESATTEFVVAMVVVVPLTVKSPATVRF